MYVKFALHKASGVQEQARVSPPGVKVAEDSLVCDIPILMNLFIDKMEGTCKAAGRQTPIVRFVLRRRDLLLFTMHPDSSLISCFTKFLHKLAPLADRNNLEWPHAE